MVSESNQIRPKCEVCTKRVANRLPLREGQPTRYRKTCTRCRRSPLTLEQTEIERLARQKQATKIISHVRPRCGKCGVNVCRIRYNRQLKVTAEGLPFYEKTCNPCHRGERTIGEQYPPYRKNALAAQDKPHCTYCGFEPLHVCQLDVDHIDGDKQNNGLDNLQVLCANCHRLKTWLAGDDRKWIEATRKDKKPWGHWWTQADAQNEEGEIILPLGRPSAVEDRPSALEVSHVDV